MKITIVSASAIALAICATSASATKAPSYNQDQGQLQGQAQGQIQGQAQGQLSYNANDNDNYNSNRAYGGKSYSDSYALSAAQSDNNVHIQGDRVEGSVALSALASGGCGGGGFTAGADGVGFGLNFSSDYCKNIAMAAAAELYGGNGAAYLCATDRQFRRTQQAICTSRTAVTNQDYGSKVDTVASTRTATPTTLYTACEVIGNTPHITIPAEFIGDAAYTQRAAEACWATRN